MLAGLTSLLQAGGDWLGCCVSPDVGDVSLNRFTPSQDSKLPVATGQVIDERYRVEAFLGEGGMGIVCSATHVLLRTPVAIKLIHADLMHEREAVQRFINEARAAASLKGEHIARVFDVGQLETGQPYLVMEYLDGIGLDEYLREKGPLPQAEAVDIVLQACEGLAEAHALSLVHRDVKPANLFLARRPDGLYTLKILDFGISKRLARSTTRGLTNPDKSLGSPWYMSPEQMLSASKVDPRADVWSLGVLLYELLTKQYPFDGESVPQVCAAVLTAAPPRLSQVRTDVDRDLDAVLQTCLEKQPESRFSSVSELARALKPFASPAMQAVPLALPESDPPSGLHAVARDEITLGSLAPIHGQAQSPKARGSWLAVLTLFAALVASAAFAWPYLRHHYAANGLPDVSRAALPWEPRLLPDPVESEARAPAAEPPTLLQRLGPARSVPEHFRESSNGR